MTLREALATAARPAVGPEYKVSLCCGFEPLHLNTFLKAHLRARLTPSGRGVAIATGQFGDLAGNCERAMLREGGDPIVVVIEWPDLDPRLGLREASRVAGAEAELLLTETSARLNRLGAMLQNGAARRRVAVTLPEGPLPPWIQAMTGQSSGLALALRAQLSTFAAQIAVAQVRVSEPIGGNSYDLRTHLQSGFPFPLAYADLLAERLASLLLPAPPKKGLITDLDNTLWKGVVGDDGPDHVHWDSDHGARLHGIYQQFLGHLAQQGILIGVASKNDAGPVNEALARPLLFDKQVLFPIVTAWTSKSESIRRIAQTWNIGTDSIVFVDDNPLELEEIRLELPDVECVPFPDSGVAALPAFLTNLSRLFAKETAGEEDRIRAASVRVNTELAAASKMSNPEALLKGLQAQVHADFRVEPFDARALELLNKTNQFNINGRRWEESDFRRFLSEPDSLLCVLSYEDRFGPLGKIAVAAGKRQGETVRLESWVMSCRAFARRIEFATLEALFAETGAEEIVFDWVSTPRNGPTRELLEHLLGPLAHHGKIALSRDRFTTGAPRIYSSAKRVFLEDFSG